MAKLIYTAITSLDGYIADRDGKFDWSAPSEEVHAFVNDLERNIGTYLYGRRLYQTMVVWQNPEAFVGESAAMQDYARIWQLADKVVYSRTLQSVSSARTRLEPSFEADAIRRLKAAASRDISVGGANLAAEALRSGLVDECHLFLTPILVGGGTKALPDGLRLQLQLQSECRFGNGVVHLHYRASTSDIA